ncbi:MAG: hypothetical protein CVV52_03870 [Spirochaetae bacterium HGW-Spirochaetae-8]|nr:MAG: hypothetical protein CVV52_03870 [Spirochaetae bacterium HGW-Spirochaetae-8]
MTCTIIGAGRTGRGFIGRLLYESGVSFHYVESQASLVERLRQKNSYTVEFFGNTRKPVNIEGFSVQHVSDKNTIESIAYSDLVFVSVGADNLVNVGSLLAKVLSYRGSINLFPYPLYIITAENAIHPAEKLRIHIQKSYKGSTHYLITETAIFCTTIEKSKGSMDIISEDLNQIPFAAFNLSFPFELPSFLRLEKDFELLLTRKLYTYNCTSAAIAYLGHASGYLEYAEAASDPSIEILLMALYESVNHALGLDYGIDPVDKNEFACASLKKFQNKDIYDSIERNARNASRKLGPDERLLGPLRLLVKHNIAFDVLSMVIATACRYGIEHEQSMHDLLEHQGLEGILKNICFIDVDSSEARRIIDFYHDLNDSKHMRDTIFAWSTKI